MSLAFFLHWLPFLNTHLKAKHLDAISGILWSLHGRQTPLDQCGSILSNYPEKKFDYVQSFLEILVMQKQSMAKVEIQICFNSQPVG